MEQGKQQGVDADVTVADVAKSDLPLTQSEWTVYKMGRANALVRRGFSVSWQPNADHGMEVYRPSKRALGQRVLVASVGFSSEPSPKGLNGGQILNLTIQVRRLDHSRTRYKWHDVFTFDGTNQVDQLAQDDDAKRLYQALIDELN